MNCGTGNCLFCGYGPTSQQLQRAACYVCFAKRSDATAEQLQMRRMMVPRHIGTGHAARHINQTLDEIEAVPLWQDGDTDGIETEAGTREFRVAPPATLNDYQRSLVG